MMALIANDDSVDKNRCLRQRGADRTSCHTTMWRSHALMKALWCARCLKIAIVHDVAEGVQCRLVQTSFNQHRCTLVLHWSSAVMLAPAQSEGV